MKATLSEIKKKLYNNIMLDVGLGFITSDLQLFNNNNKLKSNR